MKRIIHCSDVHLTCREPEKAYSLQILGDIADTALRYAADFVVLAGDLFDSYDDAYALRSEVREVLAPLTSACTLLYVPGNHEQRGAGKRRLAGLDLEPLKLADQRPFELISEKDIEFLCIPHQDDYSGYQQWQVPQKAARFRIAIAHASVPGLTGYTGMSEKEEIEAGAIDRDAFSRFDVDYAALGHIHKRGSLIHEHTHIHYAGSARVWRRGEAAERGVNLITLDDSLTVEFIELSRAGQYRFYDVALSLEGTMRELHEIAKEWSAADSIEVRLSGIVDDETAVGQLERELRGYEREGRVREMSVDRSDVWPVSGIASMSIAKKFLHLWEESKPESGSEREMKKWLKARLQGLQAIQQLAEAQ